MHELYFFYNKFYFIIRLLGFPSFINVNFIIYIRFLNKTLFCNLAFRFQILKSNFHITFQFLFGIPLHIVYLKLKLIFYDLTGYYFLIFEKIFILIDIFAK